MHRPIVHTCMCFGNEKGQGNDRLSCSVAHAETMPMSSNTSLALFSSS